MRTVIAVLPLLLLAPGVFVSADEGPDTFPLLNVELVDREGVETNLVGFHRISGETLFRGYLGAAEVDVPYARVREIRLLPPARAGDRPRARIVLRSGRDITADFDQREAEQLFAGFASFGRVTVFFRDIRVLRILGRTKRSDLPSFGEEPDLRGVDARIRDREGVETELVRFQRLGVENTVPGVRGATSVTIPLRILERLELEPDARGRHLTATATLRDGGTLRFRVPTHEEETVYRGRAEFGRLRIRLGLLRDIEVHRVTPALRDLDPLEAAGGRAVEVDQPLR